MEFSGEVSTASDGDPVPKGGRMAAKKKAAKKKATKKKSAKKSAPKPVEVPNFVVKSVCKEVLKGMELNIAGDALDGLNMVVGWYLEQAGKRAEANGRKTVRAHDFLVPC